MKISKILVILSIVVSGITSQLNTATQPQLIRQINRLTGRTGNLPERRILARIWNNVQSPTLPTPGTRYIQQTKWDLPTSGRSQRIVNLMQQWTALEIQHQITLNPHNSFFTQLWTYLQAHPAWGKTSSYLPSSYQWRTTLNAADNSPLILRLMNQWANLQP